MHKTPDMFVSFCSRSFYGGVHRHKCRCCVSSNTFSFNCILMSELSIFVVLSREVLSHCSSTDCIVESTVANFWTSLKDVISARFYVFTMMMVMIEVIGCVMLCHLVNLLPLALQPAVGFGLSNNILPFFSNRHQLCLSSHLQHLKISYFLFPSFPGSSPPPRPFQFLSEDLFGYPILLNSLQVT